jgi:hypothetical protein
MELRSGAIVAALFKGEVIALEGEMLCGGRRRRSSKVCFQTAFSFTCRCFTVLEFNFLISVSITIRDAARKDEVIRNLRQREEPQLRKSINNE